jgi:hypothetical protein
MAKAPTGQEIEYEYEVIPVLRTAKETVYVVALRYWSPEFPPRYIYIQQKDWDEKKIPEYIKMDMEKREQVRKGKVTL